MKSARSASDFHLSSRGATLACVLLCGFSFVSDAQGGPLQPVIDPSQLVTDHVQGVVVNALDGRPVGRALVTSGDQRLATMTDSLGRFGFDLRHVAAAASGVGSGFGVARPMGGRQMMTMLMVHRPGFLMKQFPISYPIDAQGGSEPIEVRIIPEAVIRGHLSFSDPERPTVQVQLHRKQVVNGIATWQPAGGAQANSHGDFQFSELRAGEYKVATAAWVENRTGGATAADESFGYAPGYYADSTGLASSPAIHVATGATVRADLNLHGVPFYRVTIPVANLAKGVGANVFLLPQGDSQTGGQWNTSGLALGLNSNTGILEGSLPNGTYDVRVSAFGPVASAGRGKVEVAGKPVKGEPIVMLVSGVIPVIVHKEYTAANADNRTTFLMPGVQANGRIIQPIQSMQRSLEITLQPIDGLGPGGGMRNTNKGDEDLALENVVEGTYRVTVYPFRGYVSAMSSRGVDLLRQPLVVGAGGASDPIEITLRDDTATLHGTVVMPATASVPGGSASPGAAGTQPSLDTVFRINCIPLGGAARAPAVVAYTGTLRRPEFTLGNLAPGEYLILASDASAEDPNVGVEQIEYENPDVLRAYESKGTVVTLAAGQKAEIRVPLLAGLDGGN